MKNKIFLTSVFALAFACPAFAVDGNATIENGDTCNVDNLGTSTNNDTANLEAIWTLQSIECPAGTSFNASTASCDTCASGSWCVAGTYDVENNQTGAGATLCSSLTGGYNSSLAGATSNTDCYKGCVASDVAHAETVSGNVYYDPNNANGNKQCSATACAAGWHLSGGAPDFSNLDIANMNRTDSARINNSGNFAERHYESNGGSSDVTGSGKGQAYYGISENNEWAAEFENVGIVKGMGRCSTTPGAHPAYMGQTGEGDILASLTDETGEQGAQYCWCQLTGYKASGSSAWQSAVSSWVFYNDLNSAGNCANGCANNCANDAGNYAGFRSALFGALGTSLATCEANNIGLAWYNDTVANNGETITPNNSAANQCTYSGTITVPTNTMEKTGYTFGGWKLRTNN